MKMILARIGWSATYDSDEQVVGGGYEKGSDRFNFQIGLDSNLYGFFPVGKGRANLNLDRIATGSNATGFVDDVLVVWVATHPERRGQRVVGWYEHARVLASDKWHPDRHQLFRVRAKSSDCTLLREGDRKIEVAVGVIDGQTSIRYSPQESDDALSIEFERIRKFIDEWKSSTNMLSAMQTKPVVEAEAEFEREQGFLSDAEIRRVIEKHAEQMVISAFLNEGITLEPHPKSQWPWDFKYLRDGLPAFIEVKGTQSSGQRFILTVGEVEFARSNPNMELCLVTNILLSQTSPVVATGGKLLRVRPWHPDQHTLQPTQFRCALADD